MTRYLLDANTVLALLDPQHVFHEAAHRWAERTLAEGNGATRWLTCSQVQNDVLRIASHPDYPNHVGPVSAVRDVLNKFCARPHHEFCVDDVSLLGDKWLVDPSLLTPSRVRQLHLLALAVAHGARLATFDRHVSAEAIRGGADALELLVT